MSRLTRPSYIFDGLCVGGTIQDGIPFRLSHRDFNLRGNWQDNHTWTGLEGWYQNHQYRRVTVLTSHQIERLAFEFDASELEQNYDFIRLYAGSALQDQATGIFSGPLNANALHQDNPFEPREVEFRYQTDYSVSREDGFETTSVTAFCDPDAPYTNPPVAKEIGFNQRYEGILMGVNDTIFLKVYLEGDRSYNLHLQRVSPRDNLQVQFAPFINITDSPQWPNPPGSVIQQFDPQTDCPTNEQATGCDAMMELTVTGSGWRYIHIQSQVYGPYANDPASGMGHFRLLVNRQLDDVRTANTIHVWTIVSPGQPEMQDHIRDELVAASEAFYTMTNGNWLINNYTVHWGSTQDPPGCAKWLLKLSPDGIPGECGGSGGIAWPPRLDNRVCIARNFWEDPMYTWGSPTEVMQQKRFAAVVAHEWGHGILDLDDEYDTGNGEIECGHSTMGYGAINSDEDYLTALCTEATWGLDQDPNKSPSDHPQQAPYYYSSWAELAYQSSSYTLPGDFFVENAPAVRYWPVSPGGSAQRAAGYPFNQHVSFTNCNPGDTSPSCYWPGCQ